jgi:eukaryotic-like serine/threonine-protein kinase
MEHCTAMTTLAPGTVVAAKFRIERVLGEGGMGIVLAAHHLHLGRMVAIKLLKPDALAHPDIVARFGNEARSASRIQSEHVARVLDVGALDSGEPYMVMEYLEGLDLSKYVRQRGPLAIEEAVDYLLQACEALAEAHVAGIVHRDLKPANLYLTRRADGSSCVKVLDFGISKASLAGDQAAAQHVTQTASVLGTPGYMAPEQLRSSKYVDARTDIWALGVILHELLTGKLAFQGSTVPEIYAAILASPPEPLRSARPDAPPQLEAIIAKCLEKDANRRFANVGELAVALVQFAPASGRLSAERIGRITGVAPAAQAPAAVVNPLGATAMPSAYGPGYTSAPTMGATPQSHAPMQGMPSMHTPHGQTPVHGYGAPGQTPPQGYGVQGPAPMHPQMAAQYPSQMQPNAPMGAYPAQAMPPQQPAKAKMHPSTIALIAILGLIVVTFGGCMSCLCLAPSGTTDRNSIEPPDEP